MDSTITLVRFVRKTSFYFTYIFLTQIAHKKKARARAVITMKIMITLYLLYHDSSVAVAN